MIPPEPDPPGPGPDPPEPEPEVYTFSFTNHMSQSLYFRASAVVYDESEETYSVAEWSDVSSLIPQNGSVNLTVPQGYTIYRVYYKSSSEITSNDYFRVYVNGTATPNIYPETGKETFTVQYWGNNASTVGVWS